MKEIIGINIIGLMINNVIPSQLKKSRIIGMVISIITLYIILGKLLLYNNNNSEYQDRLIIFYFSFGLDGIGLGLIGLIGVLDPIILILVKRERKEEKERKRIINYLLIIKTLIIILFSSLDLFIFFITFELLLIPMFLLISRYGSKYNYFLPRLEAGLRFFMYTMLGSLLMLISIIIIYTKYGTTSNELLNLKISHTILLSNNSDINLLQIIWIFLFFSFLIKIPMFPFHTWLPLAHSDAPTIGSIILAALLLKLGSFGILRYSLYLFSPINMTNTNTSNSIYFDGIYKIFLPIILILALLSIYYSSILTIRAIYDFKRIIAYSSIIHMNFSIFGFFSKNFIGLVGSSLLMFTHAFISSALFLLIGLLYKRYHSRFIYYFQGLSSSLPLFSFFLFFFSFANISLPFCFSFLSEFFILLSSFLFNPLISFLLVFSLLFSSCFIIWFLIRLLFGYPSPYLCVYNNQKQVLGGYKDLSFNELITLIPFFFFTLFFTFFPQPFISLFSLPILILI